MFAKLTTEQRYVMIVSAVLAALVGVLWLGIGLFGRAFAESVVAGEGPFAYMQGNAMRLLVNVPPQDQATYLLGEVKTYVGRLTLVSILCQALIVWGSLRYPRLFTDYFTADSHALNLAIFRICFYAVLLPRLTLKATLYLVSLPADSRVAPPGLAWFVQSLPESPQAYVVLYWLFVASCVLAMIGLWTRYACIMATVLTFYLMGITQIFGKIEHQHYLVWVGALLSASRCADVLSVDAWKTRATWWSRPRSQAYALPFRFIWLFLGLIYFFPGLWKYVIGGPDWFLTDNLQSRMLLQLFVREGFEPLLPVHQYPLLCKFGGLMTIVLEVAFILLVFFPVARYLVAASAVSFHWMVKLFLGISFWPIQVLYITFFDWHKIFAWIRGRTDSVASNVNVASLPPIRTRAVVTVATVILVGNTICGFILLDSWPFGVYPTFARVIGPTYQSLSFTPVDAEGNELSEIQAFFDPTVREIFGVTIGRLGGILEHVTRMHPDRSKRLEALWDDWHEQHPEIADVAQVKFYLVDYSTKPGHNKEPISRTLLETLSLPSEPSTDSRSDLGGV